MTKTQTDVASEDTPASLAEAEKLLTQHQTIREEIDNYTEDYSKMMEYGEKITAEPSTQDDPQYMFLRERLKALKDGWAELQQMWENRQQLLSQSLSLQMLNRDARQAEVILTQQEVSLKIICWVRIRYMSEICKFVVCRKTTHVSLYSNMVGKNVLVFKQIVDPTLLPTVNARDKLHAYLIQKQKQ